MVSTCPVCLLVFRSPNEVAWHIHHEHNRLTDDKDLQAEVAQAVSAQLSWESFRELLPVTADPAVSLLLATLPAGHSGHMADADSRWAHFLAISAGRLMARDLKPDVLATMALRLDKVMGAAEHGPYDKGLAVYVSMDKMAVYRLPFEPRTRAVVARHFAVRDILEALLRFPRYRVLVIGGHEPRILEGCTDHLEEVGHLEEAGRQERAGRAGGVPLLAGDQRAPLTMPAPGHIFAFAREADAALAARTSHAGELPLIVVGQSRFVASWGRQSPWSALLVGTVHTHHVHASAHIIAQLALPVVNAWQEARQAVDSACFEHAQHHDLVRWGVAPAWAALKEGKAESLWARRDFAAPAVLHGPDDAPVVADQPGAHGAVDDVIEELIRVAVSSGASVHLAGPGTMRAHEAEPVAAQLAHERVFSRPGSAHHRSHDDGAKLAAV